MTVPRQSKIIIGISVVVVASFVVAFALAVGGLCEHSPNGSQVLGAGLESNNIFEPNTGNEHFVPVASKYELGPFDTEAGEIELIAYNFPYITPDGEFLPLPLCIDNVMAQTWWFDLRIDGGYTPEETAGFWPELGIVFYQDQDKDGIAEQIQGWNIEWTLTNPDDPCCADEIWHGVPAWCGNTVCLDSNQYPVLTGGLEDFVSECTNDLGFIPGKEVYIKIGLLFSGCPLDDQQFAYVLAQ
ncbi:MAG: hypothetical protein ACTSO8_07475 [Promethearchaeota archaeon]